MKNTVNWAAVLNRRANKAKKQKQTIFALSAVSAVVLAAVAEKTAANDAAIREHTQHSASLPILMSEGQDHFSAFDFAREQLAASNSIQLPSTEEAQDLMHDAELQVQQDLLAQAPLQEAQYIEADYDFGTQHLDDDASTDTTADDAIVTEDDIFADLTAPKTANPNQPVAEEGMSTTGKILLGLGGAAVAGGALMFAGGGGGDSAEGAAEEVTSGGGEAPKGDTTAPQIVGLPNDIVVLNDAGQAGAVVNWAPPTASDDEELKAFSTNHNPGDFYDIGETEVIYTAIDKSGNITEKSFTVRVVDNEDPEIHDTPANIVKVIDIGLDETDVTWEEPTTTDNSGSVELISSRQPNAIFQVGNTNINYIASDPSGNQSNSIFNVEVIARSMFAVSAVKSTFNNGGNGYVYEVDAQGNFHFINALLLSADPNDVKIIDIDFDGDRDVLFATKGSPVLYLNNGDVNLNNNVFSIYQGDFITQDDLDTRGAHGLTVIDVNNDGRLDVVYANGGDDALIGSSKPNTIYLQQPDGSFADSFERLGIANTQEIAAADFDLDGDIDLVAANLRDGTTSQQNTIYINDGQGNYTPTSNALPNSNEFFASRAVAIADLNNDGHLDIVFANEGNNTVYYGNDGIQFTDSNLRLGNEKSSDVELADLNNDGYIDLVFTNADSANKIYFNDQNGGFIASSIDIGGSSNAVVVTDLNDDGWHDLTVTNDSGTTAYLSDTKGGYSAGTPFSSETNKDFYVAEALADINIAAVEEVVDEDAGTLLFNITLHEPSDKTVTVSYAVTENADGRHATNGIDYSKLDPNTVVFQPGETSKVIQIQLNNDSQSEQEEMIEVSLFNALNGVIGEDSSAIITINESELQSDINLESVSAIKGDGDPDVDGTYTTGDAVFIQVKFSGDVYVYGGVPHIELEGIDTQAVYVTGSGSDTLTFLYQVENGDMSADLAYRNINSLELNNAVILDAKNQAMSLKLPKPGTESSLSGSKDIAIDTSQPADAPNVHISNATLAESSAKAGAIDSQGRPVYDSSGNVISDQQFNPDGSPVLDNDGNPVFVDRTVDHHEFDEGDEILIDVNFENDVYVYGNSIQLELNGMTYNAYLAGGDGTSTLTFRYVVERGDNTQDLAYLSSGAIVLDNTVVLDLNNKPVDTSLPAPGSANSLSGQYDIVIDTPPLPPESDVKILEVTTPHPDGVYTTNETIFIDIKFDDTVFVNTLDGTPTLDLTDIHHFSEEDAIYVSGSGTDTLRFQYNVKHFYADRSPDLGLEFNALKLNGALITDSDDKNVLPNKWLPQPYETNSLQGGHAIEVDTTLHLPLVEGFEGNLPWSSTGNWTYGTPTGQYVDSAVTGEGAAYINTLGNGSPADSTLTTGAITVNEIDDYNGMVMFFDLKYDFNSPDAKFLVNETHSNSHYGTTTQQIFNNSQSIGYQWGNANGEFTGSSANITANSDGWITVAHQLPDFGNMHIYGSDNTINIEFIAEKLGINPDEIAIDNLRIAYGDVFLGSNTISSLVGTEGDDLLAYGSFYTGNAGKDIFVVNPDENGLGHNVVITDFTPFVDKIDVRGWDIKTVHHIDVDVNQNNNVILDLDFDGTFDVELQGINDPDAIVADYFTGILDSNPTEVPPIAHTVMPTTSLFYDTVATGDINGDGNVDILTADVASGKFYWLQNDGNKNFNDVHELPDSFYNGLHDVMTLDFDGDTDLDIVGISNQSNDPNNIDNDGALVIYKNGDSINGPDNGSSFTNESLNLSERGGFVGVEAGDFNNDQVNDAIFLFNSDFIVFTNPNDGMHLYDPNGNGVVSVSSSTPTAFSDFVVADFNSDGYSDFVSATADGTEHVTLWLNDQSATYFDENNTVQVATTLMSVNDIAVANIDGRNGDDVVGINYNNDTIYWWENTNGDGTNWNEHLVDNLESVSAVTTADMDGDGDIDILAAGKTDDPNVGQVVWYENKNGGNTWDQHIIDDNADPFITSLATANLDDDQQLEVIGSGETVVWWDFYEN